LVTPQSGPTRLARKEGINTKSWFVGNNGSGSTPTDLCSSKTVSNFSSVYGICPEGAGTEGSYLMDGVFLFCAYQPNQKSDGTFGSFEQYDGTQGFDFWNSLGLQYAQRGRLR